MAKGLKAKKAFGQHFLVDEQVLEAIMERADIRGDDIVLEIGPGKGILTRKLAEKAAKVFAVDIDPDMIEYSKKNLKDFDNVEILLANIIDVDLNKLLPDDILERKIKVIANIPYYITTPILEWLLNNGNKLKSALLMVQFEVAKKLTARPATQEYSSITVKAAYCAEVDFCFMVRKDAFIPQPKVDSAVISFEFKADVNRQKDMFYLIDEAFKLRRKNLKNSFKSGRLFAFDHERIDEVLNSCGIDGKKRAEELSVDDYIMILDELNLK